MLEQLKRCLTVDANRQVRTLTKPELEHIAIGAISAYELKRAELEAKERAEELSDPIDDLFG